MSEALDPKHSCGKKVSEQFIANNISLMLGFFLWLLILLLFDQGTLKNMLYLLENSQVFYLCMETGLNSASYATVTGWSNKLCWQVVG